MDDTDGVQLLLRIRDHQDRAAFAELFRHYAPRVKAFLMKAGASVATWVFTIARNRRIDAIRKARRPEPEDLPWGPEGEADPADALELQQESARLGEAIALLPAKQRDLIERAYFGDLSHSEIAAQTGLPLGTIKSRIRLALERLRHQMT